MQKAFLTWDHTWHWWTWEVYDPGEAFLEVSGSSWSWSPDSRRRSSGWGSSDFSGSILRGRVFHMAKLGRANYVAWRGPWKRGCGLALDLTLWPGQLDFPIPAATNYDPRSSHLKLPHQHLKIVTLNISMEAQRKWKQETTCVVLSFCSLPCSSTLLWWHHWQDLIIQSPHFLIAKSTSKISTIYTQHGLCSPIISDTIGVLSVSPVSVVLTTVPRYTLLSVVNTVSQINAYESSSPWMQVNILVTSKDIVVSYTFTLLFLSRVLCGTGTLLTMYVSWRQASDDDSATTHDIQPISPEPIPILFFISDCNTSHHAPQNLVPCWLSPAR